MGQQSVTAGSSSAGWSERASAVPPAAARLEAVASPVIPEVAALTRQTPGTLSLAQGMVHWAPPPGVDVAVRQALDAAASQPGGCSAALHRYGAMAGEPELLAAIGTKLRHQNQLDLEGSALLVTAGSNMAFNAVAQVICDPGSEVLLPVPYYFNHAMAIQLAGGVPVPVEAGWIPDPEILARAITPRSRAIVTISPNNPSGLVIPASVLAAINALCERHGLFHINDEAYELFVHGAEPHWSPGSLAGSGAHTISLYSLSKAYGMAGWRIGYAALPQQLMAAVAKVQDTVMICPPLLNQRAALAALEAGPAWCASRIAALGERRRQLVNALNEAAESLPCALLAQPDGAFYALLRIDAPGGTLGSRDLMRRLVLEQRLASVDGASFGLVDQRHGCVLRLSYGMLNAAELEEALRRLRQGIKALIQSGPSGP
ncbi:aminotransferase class I/II-fold pyridoxal phosphate-dependent enzyme [Synechococcus sp. CBW1002]|jgi:aspartate/methionine/tyrosine aminotransferase|nr:aminotransferase class I/II-fold pyridoxal phosphate-dependent enzyme [Synechococcus sp. CBW1002]